MIDKDELDLIYEIERECNTLSRDIIIRLCKRAIKEMNKQDAYLAGSTDDYHSSFSFFDILSIELQEKCYDEINPFLGDYVHSTLYSEYEKLPAIEKFVIDHSDFADHLECDLQAIKSNIYEVFRAMLNKHYTTRKIQTFLSRI